MNLSRLNRLTWILTWLIFALILLVIINQVFIYYSTNDAETYRLFYDTDLLSIPDFLYNLIWQHGNLKDWALPDVTYIFPDMVLTAPIFLFSKNIQFNIIIYAILQMVLFAMVLGLIFFAVKRTKVPFRLGLFSGLVALLLLSKGYLADNEILDALIASNVHIGQLLSAYFCLFLLLLYVNSNKTYLLVIIFCLAILSIISDLVFFASFCAPAIVSIAIFTILRYMSWQRGCCLIIYLVATIVVGKSLFAYLPLPYTNHYHTLSQLQHNLDSLNIVVYHLWLRALWMYHNNWLIALLWLVFIPAAVISLIMARHNSDLSNQEEKQIQLLLIFTLASVVVGLLVVCMGDKLYLESKNCNLSSGTDIYTGFRHMQSVVITPLFIGIPLLLYRHIALVRLCLANNVVFSVLLLCLPFTYFNSQLSPKINNTLYRRFSMVQCLDQAIEKYHLHAGIATYWHARVFALFNQHKVPVVTVTPQLEIRHWMNTLQFYRRKDFDFALISSDDSKSMLTYLYQNYGKPTTIVSCPRNIDVYVYNNGVLNTLFTDSNISLLQVKNHHIAYHSAKQP